MIFPGTVIRSVGESPRHNVVIPSFRAIFLSPSNVELNARFCVSSTAHSVPANSPILGPARQYSPLFVAKKTSRQHAVTPRFGDEVLNVPGEAVARFRVVVRGEGDGCD